jgi:hypothetical protein
MAGLNLTPLTTGGRSRTPLEDIPATVAETIEEAFAYFQTADSAPRLQTEPFPTVEDADDFLRLARSYAYQRPAGRVIVSGNPARVEKGKPEYVARFSVTEYVE